MRWTRAFLVAVLLVGIAAGCASEKSISVAAVRCSGLADLKRMISEVEARKGSNLLIEQQYPDDADTVWRKLLLVGVGSVVSYDPEDGKELPPVDEELLNEPVGRWATLDVIEAGCESGTMQVRAVGDTVEVVPDVAYNSRFRLVPDSK